MSSLFSCFSFWRELCRETRELFLLNVIVVVPSLCLCSCWSSVLSLLLSSVMIVCLRTFIADFTCDTPFSISLFVFIYLSLSQTHLIFVSLSISFALWFSIYIIIFFFISLSASVPSFLTKFIRVISFISFSIFLYSCKSFLLYS